MPQVVVAAIVAGVANGFAAGLWVAFSWSSALAAGAMSLLSMAIADKPASAIAKERKQTIREAIQPHRYIYGEVLVGAVLSYATSTGERNEYIHLVLTLAGHECDSITEYHLEARELTDYNESTGMARDEEGVIQDGMVRIRYRLGAQSQTVYQELVDESLVRQIESGGVNVPYNVAGIEVLSAESGALTGLGQLRVYPALNGVSDVYEVSWQAFGDTEGPLLDIFDSNGQKVLASGTVGSDLTINVNFDWSGYQLPNYEQATTSSTTQYSISEDMGETMPNPGNVDEVIDVTVGGIGSEESWTAAHTGNGRCHVYMRLQWDSEIFPNGLPGPKFLIKGKKVRDPRDVSWPADTPTWSDNPALCTLDYIMDPNGINASAAEVHQASWSAAANRCDTLTEARDSTVITSSTGGSPTAVKAVDHGLRTGDEVLIAGHSGSLNNTVETLWTVTVENKDTLTIPTASTGTGGTIQLYQKRFILNGTFSLDASPPEVIEEMVTAMGGVVVYQEGKFFGHAAAPEIVSSMALGVDDLRGNIRVRPRKQRKDLYNGIRATFIDQHGSWEAADIPPIADAGYALEDSEEIYKTVNFPFTTDSYVAQRLAKLDLERGRQAMVVEFPAKLTALGAGVWDVIDLNIDALGFEDKQFRILERTLTTDGGIDLLLKEEADIYDWLPGYSQTADPAPNTTLTNFSGTMAPENLWAAHKVYLGTDDLYRHKLIVTWNQPHDEFIVLYQGQYKHNEATEWTDVFSGPGTTFEILDLSYGAWDIRVRSVNHLAAASQWVHVQQNVLGTGEFISRVGLPDPVDPRVEFIADENGKIDSLTFGIAYDTSSTLVPAGYALMWSVSHIPNQFKVGTVSGTKLYMDSVDFFTEIKAGDGWEAKTGSTATVLVVRDASEPLTTGIDLAGMWWVRVNNAGAGRVSKWRKVRSYDETKIYFTEENALDVVPLDGDPIEILEIAWRDERADEFNLIYVTNGSSYEVIRFENVRQDGGGNYLSILERGAEGTTELGSIDGFTAYYYPAPGAETVMALVPFGDLRVNPSNANQRIADLAVNISLPPGVWAAATVASYIPVTDDEGQVTFLRSNILPLTYGLLSS